MRTWIRRIFHAVEGWIALIHMGIFLAFVPLPLSLTTSNTLREYICIGAALGGLLGYLFSLIWAGKGRPKCRRARAVCVGLAFLSLVVMIFFLQTLDPVWVTRHPSLKGLREELILAPKFTNWGLGVLGGLTMFLAISAVTLSSPKLWNTRLKDL
jgi:hypothetical protein